MWSLASFGSQRRHTTAAFKKEERLHILRDKARGKKFAARIKHAVQLIDMTRQGRSGDEATTALTSNTKLQQQRPASQMRRVTGHKHERDDATPSVPRPHLYLLISHKVEDRDDLVDQEVWRHLHLMDPVIRSLKHCGFVKPTEIQETVIPLAIKGVNVSSFTMIISDNSR